MTKSNAALFRAMRYEETKMMAAVMPNLWESRDVTEEAEARPSTLRVRLAEAAGPRLYGFRAVEDVQ